MSSSFLAASDRRSSPQRETGTSSISPGTFYWLWSGKWGRWQSSSSGRGKSRKASPIGRSLSGSPSLMN
ncbi:unnamed protein product [Staurois parvus]|uniref:Uncharacterized protein n=1 Tax=Staurois parvus TaxID=386267 RepID=A0ABN9H9M3_9NEOB|nr:unnamed protein product [Staurois parvus]